MNPTKHITSKSKIAHKETWAGPSLRSGPLFGRYVYILMKHIFILLLSVFSSLSNSEITLDLPEGWEMSSGIISVGNKKVGETTSKESWPYPNGEEFILSFRKGFADDPHTTKFISSGDSEGIYWVCREGEYWDGNGGGGIWYARRFWVNGPILTLYSYESCSEKFSEAFEIASTLSEE